MFAILAVLSIPTVKTLAVSSRGGEEVLKAHAPAGACAASSCWLCAYVRGSGPPGTPPSFLSCLSSVAFFSLRGLLFLGRQSSVHRRVRPLLFSVGHFLVLFARSADNWLLRMFSPSLGDVSVSAPVELSLTFPRLLVLRLGLNSHSHKPGGLPSSAQFAFRRLGDPQHATILSSAAFCCRCLLSVPWC